MPVHIHDAKEQSTSFGGDTDSSIDPRPRWLVAAWWAREAGWGYSSNAELPEIVARCRASHVRHGSRQKTTNSTSHSDSAPALRRPLSRTTRGRGWRNCRHYSRRSRACTWPFAPSSNVEVDGEKYTSRKRSYATNFRVIGGMSKKWVVSPLTEMTYRIQGRAGWCRHS